ncbi:MAG: prolyl oligopeptidase family serine peptidase [Clostridia bacterium]|nr:prolyl oligopeptidase family serine peptidase [Clostridia bacterium]
MEKKNFGKLNYLIRFPENYQSGEKYPVLIYLHGAGTRECDISEITNGGAYKYAESDKEFPFILAAPHCTENSWLDLFETLEEWVKMITSQDFCDKERVYLTGASMGGYATWSLAMSMPEYFAAIVPVCGGGMAWNTYRLRNVPVWAFHGAKDPIVLCSESEEMVRRTNKNGGNARLTVYPENEHDAWTDTYSNPEVYKWFLTYKNININEITGEFDDSNIYA